MDNRIQFIKQMKNKRMSYREIGQLLGISGQRVHQLLTGYKSSIPAPITKVPNGWQPTGDYNTKGIKLEGRDFIRELVRRRDNYTCQICLKEWKPTMRRFDVHHMNPKYEGLQKGSASYTIDKVQLPKMITLCHKCHMRLDHIRKGRTPSKPATKAA